MAKQITLYENGRFNEENKVTVEDCPFHDLPRDPDDAAIIVDETDVPPLQVGSQAVWKGQRTIFVVICGDCGATGPWGRDERNAIKLWNQHARKEA